jgi:hypothetical protein
MAAILGGLTQREFRDFGRREPRSVLNKSELMSLLRIGQRAEQQFRSIRQPGFWLHSLSVPATQDRHPGL